MTIVYKWVYLPPYNEYEVARLPKTAGHYGEMPSAFIKAIIEKTGLEEYELQDYLDSLMVDLFTGWALVDWISLQYQILADRQKRMSRFRTYLFIAMAACIIVPAVWSALQSALAVWSHTVAWNISTFARFKLALVAFTDVMGAGFSAFLAAIHYETLLGIHNIAELVSPTYRDVLGKIYGEISKVSDALGYGPYFLLLLTQNSKRLVQDVSSTFGMEWDLSEVQWLSTFQGYMTKFSGAAYKYRDNPEALLFDMGRWVETDAVNAKGSFMGNLTKTLDNVVKDVENFVGDLVTIRDDVNKMVAQLPEKISKQIGEAISPYISKFDDFITDTYDPYRKEIDRLVDGVKEIQDAQRLRMLSLADRLKKPADYLLEIDDLDEEARLDQERKLADLSTREYGRDVAGFIEYAGPADMELRKIREAFKHVGLMPLGFPEEMPSPVRPSTVNAIPRATWFIGDF